MSPPDTASPGAASPDRHESLTDAPHGGMSTHDKLIYMANQIGTFFRSQGEQAAVDGTAEHIRKFWNSRMLKQIYAHLDAGGAGLEPNVKKALEKVRAEAN